MDDQNFWRRCGSCKKEIPFGAAYQACSISSCRKYVYCSVTCWDVHSSILNHKSAWAEEETAPMKGQVSSDSTPRRRIVVTKSNQEPTSTNRTEIPRDILIVASKLKNYVKAASGFSTSANAMEALSDIVRFHCDKAIENAKSEGRKTVMDRDF